MNFPDFHNAIKNNNNNNLIELNNAFRYSLYVCKCHAPMEYAAN